MSNYDRIVSLLCPVCGYDQFESLDESFPEPDEAPDNVMLKCADCGFMVFKEELLRMNSERIEIAFEAMAKEVLDETERAFERGWK